MLHISPVKVALIALACLASMPLSVAAGLARSKAPLIQVQGSASDTATVALGFHEVHPSVTAEQAIAGPAPEGFRVYFAARPSDRSPGGYLLRIEPILTSADIADAQQGFDSRTNEPLVSFRFTKKAARLFGKFTSDNIGRPFAIVLDGKVLTAPMIRSEILGGSGQISGSFTVEAANDLAMQLRTAAQRATAGPLNGAK